MKERINDVLRQFDLQATAMRHVQNDTWLINGQYYLKAHANPVALSKILLLNEMLAQQGVPVAVFLRSSNGAKAVQLDDVGYTLTLKAEGAHADAYTGDYRRRGFLVGIHLAKLHQALQALPGRITFSDVDSIAEIKGWISTEIRAKDIYIDPEIFTYCLSFDELYHRLPRQPIHRDVHFMNMLFDNEVLTAFLDFDISLINVRILDICYFGLSILHHDYQDESKVKLWREIFRATVSGYDSISTLSEEEIQALPSMFVYIELLFVAYFARLGQVEEAQCCVPFADWLYCRRETILSL